MRTFKDTSGHEWSVRITVGTLARVLDRTGVVLTKAFDFEGETDKQLDDVSTMFAVICAVLAPQLDAVTVQEGGEAERVGVQPVGAEKLRADGEDGGLHGAG